MLGTVPGKVKVEEDDAPGSPHVEPDSSMLLEGMRSARIASSREMERAILWIEACIKDGSRVDWTEYLRNGEANEAAESKKRSVGGDGCDVKFDISTDDANATSGWSEPVELDCCCVCHENGDKKCPWCTGETECNLTKKRLGIGN